MLPEGAPAVNLTQTIWSEHSQALARILVTFQLWPSIRTKGNVNQIFLHSTYVRRLKKIVARDFRPLVFILFTHQLHLGTL
jgi:hypothetical protein